MKMLLNRILIRPKDLLREKDIGDGKKIILHYGEEEKRYMAAQTEGEVVQIGATAYVDYGYETPPVQVGDIVLFGRYSGKGVIDPETNEKLVIVNDVDIICVVKEKTNE